MPNVRNPTCTLPIVSPEELVVEVMTEAEKLALRCNESQDVKEGFIAQREKRKPVFKGF